MTQTYVVQTSHSGQHWIDADADESFPVNALGFAAAKQLVATLTAPCDVPRADRGWTLARIVKRTADEVIA